MAIENRLIEYTDGDHVMEGYLAWDSDQAGPRPAVLVSHAWAGRSEFENQKARDLAALGYVGFALDLYGKGVLGGGPDENMKLMQPFLDDRAKLQGRLSQALQLVKDQDVVDAGRVAAIGFCFGGLCVLDLARIGADLNGVVSFHGLFHPPGNTAGTKAKAKVLALHGWDDPMATPEHVVALAKEMTEAGADWQIHGYGNTLHAFTNPAANSPDMGTVYNADADRRSWQTLQNFLAEVLA